MAGGIVTIWEHENFNGNPRDGNGAVWSTNMSVSAIPRWLNDRMTSYRVRQGYRVEFYQDHQYVNLLFSVPPEPWQNAAIPWSVSDKLTAIRIIGPSGIALPERNAWDDQQWPDNAGTTAPDDHEGARPPAQPSDRGGRER